MYKVAVIGKRNDILGFMALGFRKEACDSAGDAAAILRRLVSSNEYAAVFISEEYAVLIEEEIARYRDLPMPAILPLPTPSADNGYGSKAVTDSVIRAVGADII